MRGLRIGNCNRVPLTMTLFPRRAGETMFESFKFSGHDSVQPCNRYHKIVIRTVSWSFSNALPVR